MDRTKYNYSSELEVELVYQELKRVEVYTKRIMYISIIYINRMYDK